MIKKIFQGNIW